MVIALGEETALVRVLQPFSIDIRVRGAVPNPDGTERLDAASAQCLSHQTLRVPALP
jgi:hypothetical protein